MERVRKHGHAADWAAPTGIKADTLYMRLHRGKDLSPWTIR